MGSSRRCGSAVVARDSVTDRVSDARGSGSGAPSVPVAAATCTCGFPCAALAVGGGEAVATCSGVPGRMGRGIALVIGEKVIVMGECNRRFRRMRGATMPKTTARPIAAKGTTTRRNRFDGLTARLD